MIDVKFKHGFWVLVVFSSALIWSFIHQSNKDIALDACAKQTSMSFEACYIKIME